jgi:ribosome biogenesis protein ENP2
MDSGTETAHCLGINTQHGLVAAGSSRGMIECFDPRSQTRVGVLDVARCCPREAGDTARGVPEVTALSFTGDALTLAAGTSTGKVLVFDIRAGSPTVTVDHNYELPIRRILPHSSGHLLSADERVVKIWEGRTGTNFSTVENPSTIHDIAVCPNSGLVFVANEAEKISTYFIPVRVCCLFLGGWRPSYPAANFRR